VIDNFNNNMTKVTIIGAGEVGSACANCLADRDVVNQLILFDIKEGIAEGKALDLRQSASLKRFDTKIVGVTNDYSATKDSDIVVITSGITRKPGMERSDLVSTNAHIIQNVSKSISDYSPNAVIIVVSNPLDVLCYCALKASGFRSNRVLGMSGLLDIARYRSFISEILNISVKDIQALILGGHGKTMVPMPRYTTIGGIPLRQLLSEEQIQQAVNRTRLGGEELINYLGRSAWYAAGAAICEMVESIIGNQHRVFPVCAYLNGEYGFNDIYLGVPVILGANGVEQILELELDPEDRDNFAASEKEVRENLNLMKSLVRIQ